MSGSGSNSSADFGTQVAALGAWRRGVADALRRYGDWLDEHEVADAALQARRDRLLRRLADDRMTIAFVAEFSRGKSELINALFFSHYGRRIVPSSAGRTTMCPTELLHDPARSPSIRLLPIETRLRDASLADLRELPDDWREIMIDPADAESLATAFDAVRQTRRVTVDEAAMLGLFDPDDDDSPIVPDEQGMVDIPRWRHAIVNIPDPLLAQGLVVIDTPGLNAIGNEPELTLNLIPASDAVVFVLAADAGATRSDVEVWREHIASAHQAGRMAVLNKIDGLWDDLRRPAEIDLEIARQVNGVSQVLGIPVDRVHPVSAQKALVARVQNDDALLRRSRIGQLETALTAELIHGRQKVIREQVARGIDEMGAVTAAVLQSRRRHLAEQSSELKGLRGKNRGAVDLMAQRIRNERTEFEKSLRRLQALRAIYRRHADDIRAVVAIERLRSHVRGAREVMRASKLSIGLRSGMESLNVSVRDDLAQVQRLAADVTTLMSAMYKSFAAEHGLSLGVPVPFASERMTEELERIDGVYRRHFGAISLVTTEKYALMRRFFESVASRLKALYEETSRDLDTWLRALMSPIEGQIREQQQQLRRRLDGVRRVMEASDGLEARIAEIDHACALAEQAVSLHDAVIDQVRSVLASDGDVASQTRLPPREPMLHREAEQALGGSETARVMPAEPLEIPAALEGGPAPGAGPSPRLETGDRIADDAARLAASLLDAEGIGGADAPARTSSPVPDPDPVAARARAASLSLSSDL